MRISKVTTKKGDKGRTKLGDGTEVKKSDLRIKCLGSIDELNSFIGAAKVISSDANYKNILHDVQNQLLNLGGEVSMNDQKFALLTKQSIENLDSFIEELNRELPPLKEFVIPGEDEFSSRLHVARSVCRRTETFIAELVEQNSGKLSWIQYLNRLSDLLFVMARAHLSNNKISESMWQRTD